MLFWGVIWRCNLGVVILVFFFLGLSAVPHGSARLGSAWLSIGVLSTARHGAVWHSRVRFGSAEYDMAQLGMVLHGWGYFGVILV